MDKKETPADRVLRQLQREERKRSPSQGQEMTHVAGVSFVDQFGLSLGAAPAEEATRAGAYRHIANCADALEALIVEEEEDQERRRRQDGGEGQAGDDYATYHHAAVGGGHQYSVSDRPRTSVRLRGTDRHIAIETKPNSANEIGVLVLKKPSDHDNATSSEDGENDDGEQEGDQSVK